MPRNKYSVTLIHKRVYGEIELEHCYTYADEGKLKAADIVDGEEDRLEF